VHLPILHNKYLSIFPGEGWLSGLPDQDVQAQGPVPTGSGGRHAGHAEAAQVCALGEVHPART